MPNVLLLQVIQSLHWEVMGVGVTHGASWEGRELDTYLQESQRLRRVI